MATPDTTIPNTSSVERPAEERELAGINADYKEKFGFHDSESGYAYKSPKGLSEQVVRVLQNRCQTCHRAGGAAPAPGAAGCARSLAACTTRWAPSWSCTTVSTRSTSAARLPQAISR